ncbi:MAG: hypothetical protein Q4D05_08735 [Acinetobacter sp.]|nr:hypothetical protein [Acinetobacter sp.]
MMAAVGIAAVSAPTAMANPLKSTNIKAALIQECKTQTSKGGKLTASEASKYCNCKVDLDGRVTVAQQWEVQSAINAKKNPATLSFVQQQSKALQTCLGSALVNKITALQQQAQPQKK